MRPMDREHLVTNIVAHASDGVSADVQERVIGYWTNVDADSEHASRQASAHATARPPAAR